MKGQGMLYYEYNCFIDIAQSWFNWQDVQITKHKKYGTIVTADNIPKLIPANGRAHYLDDEHIGFDVDIDDKYISISMYDFNEDADEEFRKQVIAMLARKLKKQAKGAENDERRD